MGAILPDTDAAGEPSADAVSPPDSPEHLCRALWPQLLGTLTLQYGPHVAEELAQETLARLSGQWERVRGLRSPRAWAFRVAFNLVRHPDQDRRDQVKMTRQIVAAVVLLLMAAGCDATAGAQAPLDPALPEPSDAASAPEEEVTASEPEPSRPPRSRSSPVRAARPRGWRSRATSWWIPRATRSSSAASPRSA